MDRLRAWWSESLPGKRIFVGFVGLVALGLVITTIVQSGNAKNLRSDLGATESDVRELADENEKLAADLVAAQQQLVSVEETVFELEATVAEQEAALADAADRADAGEAEASDTLAEAQRLLTEAMADQERAERLVAELTLAYSDDIDVARTRLAASTTSYACQWGTAQATDDKPNNSVTGDAAISAFAGSDTFESLLSEPEIATYLSVTATLGLEPYGVSPGEIEAIAVECWQKEDSKLNAALYTYQPTFREAVLDAACTSGASEAYADSFSRGYYATSVYQSWQLALGYDSAADYEDAVEDRFGSIEAFVAIPESQIQAESDRCSDIRDLVEPKSGGTWNVGDEIAPGIWKAYDVSDCYWARLAENGAIRDNQFGDGLRLTVNISSSDGQFEISGCTFYKENP